MKPPFHTLYYTGLSVLISLLIFGGLLIYNLSNIVHLIPKEKTFKKHSDILMNPIVLETFTPKPVIEVKVFKVEPKIESNLESPKPKVVGDSIPKSTPKDSNHITEQMRQVKGTNDSI